MFFSLILLFGLWATPASAQWTNEPTGSMRKVDCALATSNCAGQVTSGTFFDLYALPIGSDATAPRSPSTVGVARLAYSGPCSNGGSSFLSCGEGGGHLEFYNNAGTREIYMGAYFKLNSTYSCSRVGKSKIFFLRAFDNRFGAAASHGVFLFGGCGDTKTFEFSHNTGTLNNSHICGGDAIGNLCYNNVGSGTFQRGQWVKFEACIRASTTLTSRDGAVRWWVNGVEAGRYTTLNYGAGVANEWVWDQTWDGFSNGQGFTSVAEQILDHIVISIPPNGGCTASLGASVDNPPGPPGAVTGFTSTVGGVQ